MQKTSEVPRKVYPRKNDPFFIRKRALYREADRVKKNYDCDIFIIMHHRETDKIYDYQTDPKFDLEHITNLIIKDIKKARSSYKKAQKFK